MKFTSATNLVCLFAFAALPLVANAQSELTSSKQKAGYSIGINIGSNLQGQGLTADIDLESLVSGIRDGISGELKMSEQQIMEALQAFTMEQEAKAQAKMAEMAQVGTKFLAENATKDGVMTTPSGLQYTVLTKAADGSATKPSETDTVKVHYHGTLVDGSVFDSSVQRGEPISFQLNQVIPGWTEGVQLMQVGDKFRFFIPPALGYGANEAGPIPPNSVLIFDVELIGIE